MTMDTDNKDRSHHHHHHHHHTLPTTTTTNTTTSSTTGELFICFSTSRLSSSMKISSSKSILSPGRRSSRDQISLSASLSRRLRTNGSIKGGQASPMFPAGGKKRGGSFENPEPSSPKVTCIGQVRVKTKKQSKKMVTRSLSRRRSAGAEVLSFKRLERGISDSTSNGDTMISGGGGSGIQFQQYECLPPGRNQRWVHLPVTICDALRAFGSEFNCFLPCRSSSCLASGDDGKEKEEKSATAADAGGESGNGGSCGAVFARWMVAVQEKDVKGREIDMVVKNGEEKHVKDNEEDEEEEYSDLEMRRRSYRRHHGFEEIDLNLKEEDVFGGSNVEEEGEIKSRMSICVPPKNALLLMRCRSDPVKMAALANKFWNPPDAVKVDAVEGKVENGGGITEPDGRGEKDIADRKRSEEESKEAGGEEDSVAEVAEMEVTVEGDIDEQRTETKCEEEEVMAVEAVEEVDRVQESAADLDEVEASNEISVLEQEDEKEEECQMLIADEAITVDGSGNEEISDLDNPPAENNEETMCSGTTAGEEVSIASEEEDNGAEGVTTMTEDPDSPMPEQEVDTEEEEAVRLPEQEPEKPDTAEKDEEKEQEPGKGSEPENPKAVGEPTQPGRKSKERESQPSLPDCLLLMMCEPKVSMEVSKETWVCSTDFVRWLPEASRQVAAVKKNYDEKHIPNNKTKNISSVDVNPPPPAPPVQKTKIALQFQPPRSSCSYPARPPAWRPGAELIGEGIEQPPRQSVGKSKGYEPLMLKRCKSEPRKTAAKLAPEACCWKNRKLEPQLRIGAAGVGF